MPLENTEIALFGLIIWTLLLLVGIAALRSYLTLTGQRAINSYAPSGEDISPFSNRLCRAHANCYEFLPFVLAILLYAVATEQTSVTNRLALILLFARLAQSTVHLISTSNTAVVLRFTFLFAQALILLCWVALFCIQNS